MEEPKKLSGIKKFLELFKPGGLEELLLKLKSGKQGLEIKNQLGKINAYTMSEEYNPEIGGYENTTDVMFDVLDSLETEKAKTDSLLNLLQQDKNIETDSSKVVEDFVKNVMLKTKKTKAAVDAAKSLSARLKLGKGGADAILERLKESDIQRYNTSFGPKNFFGLIEGMEKGLLQPGNPAYERGLRVLKLYKDFF